MKQSTLGCTCFGCINTPIFLRIEMEIREHGMFVYYLTVVGLEEMLTLPRKQTMTAR